MTVDVLTWGGEVVRTLLEREDLEHGARLADELFGSGIGRRGRVVAVLELGGVVTFHFRPFVELDVVAEERRLEELGQRIREVGARWSWEPRVPLDVLISIDMGVTLRRWLDRQIFGLP